MKLFVEDSICFSGEPIGYQRRAVWTRGGLVDKVDRGGGGKQGRQGKGEGDRVDRGRGCCRLDCGFFHR